MDLRRFKVGDVVCVQHIVEPFYDPANRRRIMRQLLEEPVFGRVVGLTRIQLGEYKEGGEYAPSIVSPEPDYEPPYLDIKKQETVWLVRFGMLNRPVKVLDEDIQGPLDPMQHRDFVMPLMYQKRHNWPQEFRDDLSRQSKDWPRDERGRWVKPS